MGDDRDEDLEKDGVAYESVLDQPAVTECAAKPNELKLGPEELSAPAHETKWPAQAQIDEAFTAEALATPMAPDGLPDHSQDLFDGGTHPFSIDHVVCVEDNRGLVAVFNGEAQDFPFAVPPERFGSGQHLWYHDERAGEDMQLVDRGPATVLRFGQTLIVVSVQWPTTPSGRKVERESFSGSEVGRRDVQLWDFDAAKGLGLIPIGELTAAARARLEYDAQVKYSETGREVTVDPRVYAACRLRRLRCSYYKRQMFANDEQKDPNELGHRIIFRNCTHPARRSVGGASLSLDNEAIYACDYRDPRDPASEQLIDVLDLTKMRDRPDLVRVPLFGMPGDDVDLRNKEEK